MRSDSTMLPGLRNVPVAASAAHAADPLLSGAITSRSGKKP